jgi:hypothetical protein
LRDPPKFTQVCIFGLKIYHLATLVELRTTIVQLLMLTSELLTKISADKILTDTMLPRKKCVIKIIVGAFEAIFK